MLCCWCNHCRVVYADANVVDGPNSLTDGVGVTDVELWRISFSDRVVCCDTLRVAVVIIVANSDAVTHAERHFLADPEPVAVAVA